MAPSSKQSKAITALTLQIRYSNGGIGFVWLTNATPGSRIVVYRLDCYYHFNVANCHKLNTKQGTIEQWPAHISQQCLESSCRHVTTDSVSPMPQHNYYSIMETHLPLHCIYWSHSLDNYTTYYAKLLSTDWEQNQDCTERG